MSKEPSRLGRIAEDSVASLRRIPSEDPPRMRRRETTEIGRLVESLQVKYGIGRSTPEQAIRKECAVSSGWGGELTR